MLSGSFIFNACAGDSGGENNVALKVKVSCGGYHTMILKKDGSLRATGYSCYGQSGDGTNIDKLTPVQIFQ